MRPRVLRRNLILAGLGGCIAAATLTTGVAKADPITDIAYLATLDQFGVYYSSDQAAIAAGHAVCDGLGQGLTPATIVRIGQRAGGYSQTDAGYIVGAAIGAYCDQYAWMIGMPGGRAMA